MRRLFTLLVVFFLGIVVGAAFFTEDMPLNDGPQAASEVLTQTLFNVLGTTRETAEALADEIRPHISQLSYMTDEQLRTYYDALTLKYRLPSLTDEQLSRLGSALRAIGSLGGSSPEEVQQHAGEKLDLTSGLLDAGVKMLSALQRIMQRASRFVSQAAGRA